MESRTKSKVSQGMILLICQMHFGKDIQHIRIEELMDGYFNASYKVELPQIGLNVLLKVGPDFDADVMAYEVDMMKGEVKNYRHAASIPGLPVPKMIVEQMDHTVLGYRYFITEFLDGIPLSKVDDITTQQRREINKTLAGYLGKLHNKKGDAFGYPALHLHDPNVSYDVVYRSFLRMVFSDVQKKAVELPITESDFWGIVEPYISVLEEVKTPVLVHFDLWDGNIFVAPEDVTKIMGIIDWERGFYGDPIADLVSLAFNTDFSQAEYFFEIYNNIANEKIIFDDKAKIRLLLHRIYLYLLMTVECAYRDIGGSFEGQRVWAAGELMARIEELQKIDRDSRKV